jgi:hypothetical protein
VSGPPLGTADLIALLVGEFFLPPAEVGRITRLQAVYLYLHPRDRLGGLAPYGPPRSMLRRLNTGRSSREEFTLARRAEGLPDWRIRQLWEALEERAGQLARMGRDARREAVLRARGRKE